MNDNKEVKATIVAGAETENKEEKEMKKVEEFIKRSEEKLAEVKEARPPMNNAPVAGGTQWNNKGIIPQDRKEKAKYFIRNALKEVKNSIVFNDKKYVDWTDSENKAFEELKPIAEKLEEKIEQLLIYIPLQEEGRERIEQQLIEKPVADIKVEGANRDNFSIVKVSTGEIIATGNEEVIKGVLNGLYIVQQATSPKAE